MARSSLKSASLTIFPCVPQVHRSFIRSLTRENFYDIVSRTIGWDEERQQQEPRFPERYKMVQKRDEMIGFFCVREEPDYLYLQTIQLIASFRNQGYGTALLQHIENTAKLKKLVRIRLRVFKEIPAQRLYQRLSYTPIEEDEHLILMEKTL